MSTPHISSHPTDLVSRAYAADDDLARLDERLNQSSIRDGWAARTDFLEAAAGLWREGGLVSLEDLVLHDAGMDVRAPTLELGRAHMVLRARRRLATATPGWAATEEGQDALLGRAVARDLDPDLPPWSPAAPEEDALGAEIAALDRLLARTSEVLERGRAQSTPAAPTGPSNSRFDAWRARVGASFHLSPTMAAAEAGCAWDELKPIENAGWLGPLIAADMLRQRRKTRVHLAAVSYGLKSVAHDRRRARDPGTRLAAWIEGIALAAEAGLRDHDRWAAARRHLQHKVRDRRTTSKLPLLIELAMAHPLLSSGMIAAALRITPRAAQDLAVELGLREMTGRARYRAWGIL